MRLAGSISSGQKSADLHLAFRMVKYVISLAFIAVLLCSAQALPKTRDLASDIVAAQDAISVAFRVTGEALSRGAILGGTLHIDVFNRVADIRTQYVTLGLDTTNLDNLQITYDALLTDDLLLLENLTINSLNLLQHMNEDLTGDMLHLPEDMTEIQAVIAQVNAAYILATTHLIEGMAAFDVEVTNSMMNQTGEAVTRAFVSLQRGTDAVMFQHNLDDELKLVIDWRIQQALDAVQAVINGMIPS
ncbi:hypothetical protein B566_EDAN016961 [Ephemera danica]|nr:hypothetical protein B566_EDAN016961 [Ephemera danica]